MGFIEPPLELFSLERKAAWLPGGLSVFTKRIRELSPAFASAATLLIRKLEIGKRIPAAAIDHSRR